MRTCERGCDTVSHGSVYWLSRLMFFLLGFMRIRVRGQRASRLEAPILVAAPHSTFFDPIILLPCDLPKVVSRTENLHVPVIGALLRFNQAILVSRHDPASRKKVVEEVKKRATSQGKWPQVLFYPEGTCSNKKALLKFKPGFNHLGMERTWSVKSHLVDCISALHDCRSRGNKKRGEFFLPVYQPSPEEAVNPTLYANNVQKVMAKALGIPATECEFVGNLPVTVVGRLRVALEPRIWELGKALRKARYLTEGINYNLDALPVGTSGQDSDGNMDAREVALALEALWGEHDPQQLTRRAFELFSEVEAKTGTSYLHQDGFCAILRLLLGTPVVDGAELYSRLCTEDHSQDGLTLGQFQDFSLHHPDYARLFSTYLRPPPACALPKPAQASTYANGVSAISPKSKGD
ncbi:Lysophospholipid acyltransferase LPCAT4, partial [Ophiophagus hannah]